jgi:hypothetical protein
MLVEDTGRDETAQRRTIVVGLVVATVLVVGLGACASWVVSGIQIGRGHLSPMYVSPDACPYLDPIHDLEVKLTDQWTHALDGREAWPLFRAHLATELPALEVALTRAEVHVPKRIASKFETVVLDLRLGVAKLPHASSAMDLVTWPGNAQSPLVDGIGALADASDLVGNACGYRLAPSNHLVP